MIMDLGECVGGEGIVRPPSFFTIGYQSGVTKHAQVKGETRLRGTNIRLEITHTPFAVPEQVENLKTRFI